MYFGEGGQKLFVACRINVMDFVYFLALIRCLCLIQVFIESCLMIYLLGAYL